MIITQKIASIDDLNSIREAVRDENASLETSGKAKILICFGGGCIACGAVKVKEALEEVLKAEALEDKVTVVPTGCLGPCSRGPVIVMGKDKIFYQFVSPEDIREIVENILITLEFFQSIDRFKRGSQRSYEIAVVFLHRKNQIRSPYDLFCQFPRSMESEIDTMPVGN